MGVHGTAEQALNNIASFQKAWDDQERGRHDPAKSRDRKSKDKDKGKRKSSKSRSKEHKKKKRRKDNGKHEKRKRSKKSSFQSDDSSSDASKDSDDEQELSSTELLQRGRKAFQVLRDILVQYPASKNELRQVLRRIDHGESLDVRGVPDKELLQQIETLFHNLCLRRTSKGLYSSSPHHDSLLGFLATVFEEDLSTLQQATREAVQATAAAARDQPRATPPGGTSAKGASPGHASTAERSHGHVNHVSQEAAVGPQETAVEEQDGRVDEVEDDLLSHGRQPHEGSPAACQHAAGPTLAPAMAPDPVAGSPTAASVQAASRVNLTGSAEGPVVVQRRVLGPAMPPPGVHAMPQDDARDEDLSDDDLLVGPIPPSFLQQFEGDHSSDISAEQSSEIKRILTILAEALHSGPKPKPGETPSVSPYAILGVAQASSKSDVKKRYWRLSLLIHPDKCSHPKANDAFQAVGLAAKQLQDEGLRQKADERLEQLRVDKLAEEIIQQQERERQWRIARGQATAEDLRGPVGAPVTRDTWMTDLPAAKQHAAQPSQVSVTRFSLKGTTERGDTSGWTSVAGKPGQLALQAPGPAALTYVDPAATSSAAQQMEEALAAYSQQARPKSLVEQHQERLKKVKKHAKGKAEQQGPKAGPSAPEGPAEWEGKHPWRPFDREKDLGQVAPSDPAAVLKKAGDLSSRFATGRG